MTDDEDVAKEMFIFTLWYGSQKLFFVILASCGDGGDGFYVERGRWAERVCLSVCLHHGRRKTN